MPRNRFRIFVLFAGFVVGLLSGSAINLGTGAEPQQPAKTRRILYNFDGDSCMFTRAGGGGPVAMSVDDLKQLVSEVTSEGSRVDTILVCINAQVMYYPTKVGTQRGMNSTSEERAKWPATEQQRSENINRWFSSGVEPYAIMLAEAKAKNREALLTFRMNDDHGNDFLRTEFWASHPEWRLSKGALDFGVDEVRDYVAKLIEEAVRRYDSDGIELDFNRFPTYFKDSEGEGRIDKMNSLVQRVRTVLDAVGKERGRRLVLGVRIPSNYGRKPPTPESCRKIGCDAPAWAKSGWVDYVAVSEFLFERFDIPLPAWKEAIREVPIYGGIECTEGGKKEQYLGPEGYRKAAKKLRAEGADGIYLFNFFTTREYGPESWEPPFEVMRDL